MRWFVVIAGAAVLTALALAGPVAADEQSFLDAAGPIPGSGSPAGHIQMGHMICDQLRINLSTDDLEPRVFGRATWMYDRLTPQVIDAAQHELCPDTLKAGFVPGQSPEAKFLEAAGPIPGSAPPTGHIQMGYLICDQLRINPSTDDLPQRVFGRAFWVYDRITPQVVDAAQHHLCPDTLGAAGPPEP